MSKTIIEIYILIMLECRVPLKAASKIFGMTVESLVGKIKKNTGKTYYQPLDYLEEECLNYPEGLAKGIWKAKIYLRRLQKILKVESKEEKVKLLNEFITALSGPNINFATTKNSNYTEEEKESILKFRLKYAISGKNMKKAYSIDKRTLIKWENELLEGELKTRCQILKNYFAERDFSYRNAKNCKLARERMKHINE